MNRFYEFVSGVLADGKIDDAETALACDMICQDGQLDLNDVKLLVELYCGSRDRSPAFQTVFFKVLEQVFLADGAIDQSEQYYLLKMVCSHPNLEQAERDFLRELQAKVAHKDAQFEAALAAVMSR